jgi:hypothetical protein
MKKIMKLAIISSFMALGMVAANGQDPNVAGTVVIPVNFALSGFKQTGDNTAAAVRISNKDIFNAINSANNGTSIGTSAKLVLLQDQDGNIVGFQTRERGATNDISSDNISVSIGNTVRNRNAEYAIVTFNFNDGNGNDFSVSGFATIRRGNIRGRGVGTISDIRIGAAVQVAGTGDIGGEPAVLRGTVSASGARAEAAQ